MKELIRACFNSSKGLLGAYEASVSCPCAYRFDGNDLPGSTLTVGLWFSAPPWRCEAPSTVTPRKCQHGVFQTCWSGAGPAKSSAWWGLSWRLGSWLQAHVETPWPTVTVLLFRDSRWDSILLDASIFCIYLWPVCQLTSRSKDSKVQIVAKFEQHSWSWKAGPTRIPGVSTHRWGTSRFYASQLSSVATWLGCQNSLMQSPFPKRFQHVPAILQAACDRASFELCQGRRSS